MGFFSDLFGGGSTTSVSTSQTNVDVSVNPQIANVIDTAPLAQPIERLTDALAGASATAAVVQVASVAAAEQAATARQSALLTAAKDYGAIALAVLAGVFLLKGKA